MGNDSKDFFSEIEEKSNLNIDHIYDIAHSIQGANFSDEATVRQLVRHLAQLTNRPISPDKEDAIVQSVVNNDIPQDLNSLKDFLR